MKKRTNSLLYRMAVAFLIFGIVVISLNAIVTYNYQMTVYKRVSLNVSRDIGEYLSDLMKAEGDYMIMYQDYYMEHYKEMDVPYDFSDCRKAQQDFVKIFTEKYPGKTFGVDITLNELSDDVQKAYFLYKHEYWLDMFEKAREDFHIPYTYYLVPIEESNTVVYMIDGERSMRADDGSKIKPADVDKTNTEGRYLYLGDSFYNDPEKITVEWNTWFTGQQQDDFQYWNNDWGHTYAYYVPLIINGVKLGLIGTEVNVDEVSSGILSGTLIQTAGMSAILVILIFILVIHINSQFVSKIRSLDEYMRRFTTEKDVSIAEAVECISSGSDELSSLVSGMAGMIREIDTRMNELTAANVKTDRLSAELGVAMKIQRDMLPVNFPKRKDLGVFAVMSPAKNVGGDFYDFFFIDSNHLALVIADVSGKGVPAALFMVVAKTLIQNQALMGGTPARILEDVNFRLSENNAANLFVTAWLGIITLSTGELIYANAGHEYPAIRRNGGAYELMMKDDNCPPLAALDDLEYNDEKLTLAPGDSLFLYTDGVPDAKNIEGKRMGTRKMLDILNSAPDLAPNDMLNGFMNLIEEFTGAADTFDDITMMSITYYGNDKK